MEYNARVLATTTLLATTSIAALLVVTKRCHARYTSGQSVGGPQNVHTESTPRVGGLAIYMGVLAAYITAYSLQLRVTQILGVLLVSTLPACLLGLIEDLTQRVKPGWRLLATLISALIACLMTGVSITDLGIPSLDGWLKIASISIAFTAFAVAGVSHAVNLIDGMNGLASGFICVAFAGLGLVALSESDYVMLRYCFVMGASSLGFMFVNWPRGKLFLGDSGSYFLGFALAWAAVLLSERNKSVAPFSMLMVCIYPIFETIYSIWRRVIRGHSYERADRLHLHSLLLKRIIRNPSSALNRFLRTWLNGYDLSRSVDWVSNSVAGITVACMSVPAAIAAYFTHYSQKLSLLACVAFVLIYVSLYARLIRFSWCSPIRFLFSRPNEYVISVRRKRRHIQF